MTVIFIRRSSGPVGCRCVLLPRAFPRADEWRERAQLGAGHRGSGFTVYSERHGEFQRGGGVVFLYLDRDQTFERFDLVDTISWCTQGKL